MPPVRAYPRLQNPPTCHFFMSVRHLDALFAPRSVAIAGVSTRGRNLGTIVLRNLREAGFPGPVWGVSLQAGMVDGTEVFAGVADLPAVPDLAILCTPPATVPQLVEEFARKGTRAAIVLTGGLKQRSPEGGPSFEEAMLAAAKPYVLRILGPNCVGALVPGPLAFVSQSGALATAMLDWANAHRLGFSHFISLGDSADVDFGDVLDYLASDAGTRAVLMYVESVKHARKFMSAARAAARNKPVIVVKAGRAPEGARAAASHTGALAGSDAVFDAAVRRAGMLRVDTLEGLFDAAETLARSRPWCGERLAILTNGGGAGVLAADALALGQGSLATLSDETVARLDALLPVGWPRANPVDLVGDAPVPRYTGALQVLLAAPEVDGVLFMHAPTAIVPASEIAAACAPLLRAARKPVLSCWLGGATVRPAREAFALAGLASYTTPEHAVTGWMQLVHYHRNQEALLQLPTAQPAELHVDQPVAQALLREALASGREWLDEVQAKKVLEAYGIRSVPTQRVRDSEQAVRAADAIGYPVALKILSPQILHKSDVGGVALDLRSAEDVRFAALRMGDTVARTHPQAQVLGFTVQAMVRRAQGHELILGIADDPIFGPVVLFGAGGTAVEIRKDRALDLPPLNARLARDLVARTRVGALLGGYRGRAGIREPALIDALLRVSQLACDLPELAELDINPLLADADGVIALDARIRVRQPAPGGTSRLALRPYPAELEESWMLGGRSLRVRPIRPEDGERLQTFYAQSSPADLRLRFFLARREVPRSELARYCQIDYEREMAFVVLDGDQMAGEVRAICDPVNGEAEFAVQIASAWQHRGLGRMLMDKLLAYLREHGTARVLGQCLADNTGMAALARICGFTAHLDGEQTLQLRLDLRAPAGRGR